MLFVLVGCLLIRYLADAMPSFSLQVPGGVSRSVLVSYSVLGRLFEFVIGMQIALLHMERRLPLIRAWQVVGLFFVAGIVTWRAVGWLSEPMWGLAFASLLVWAITNVDPRAEQVASRFRSVQACRTFGIHSYSFFLIHWVLLFLFVSNPWINPTNGWMKFLVAGAVCFGASFVIARWMYPNIENRGIPAKVGLRNI